MAQTVYLGVVGVGGVGAAFLHQLSILTQLPALSQGSPTFQLLILARSNRYINSSGADSTPLSPSTSLASLASAPSASAEDVSAALLSTLSAARGLAVLVDNTASAAFAAQYPPFLHVGVSVVTPNKKAFSAERALWEEIQAAVREQSGAGSGAGAGAGSGVGAKAKKGVRCYHEASVGAGLPILSRLRDLLKTGDGVVTIPGVFSGTLSYLFNTFAPVPSSSSSPSSASPPKWSQAVRTAQSLGYTEPDPRDDLNGQDVACKGLIPAELNSVKTAEEFLEGLARFDGRMEDLKVKAERKGTVLRYLGSVDVKSAKVTVGLEAVDAAGPVAGFRGSDNIVQFVTERYKDSPLVVQGAGAGAEVTAIGVLADLLRVGREGGGVDWVETVVQRGEVDGSIHVEEYSIPFRGLQSLLSVPAMHIPSSTCPFPFPFLVPTSPHAPCISTLHTHTPSQPQLYPALQPPPPSPPPLPPTPSSDERIKVPATTNRVDVLDPALRRTGCLNRKIEFPLPNEEARAQILKIHSRKMTVDSAVNWPELARSTDEFGGAQLKAVCVEAGMIALRKGNVKINRAHIALS